MTRIQNELLTDEERDVLFALQQIASDDIDDEVASEIEAILQDDDVASVR